MFTPVDQYLTAAYIGETGYQVGQGAFAGATAPHQCYCFAFFDTEIDVFKYDGIIIPEPYISEFDTIVEAVEFAAIRVIIDRNRRPSTSSMRSMADDPFCILLKAVEMDLADQ